MPTKTDIIVAINEKMRKVLKEMKTNLLKSLKKVDSKYDTNQKNKEEIDTKNTSSEIVESIGNLLETSTTFYSNDANQRPPNKATFKIDALTTSQMKST